ncbi:MAG: YbdD/YjiX family protein [Rhodospirillaceae bacterium]|nr:YbdD/YjiX family protein [Rhodospirillaceae bacterium]
MKQNILTDWFKPLAFKQVSAQVVATARLMVGVPDYDAYVNHMRARHPDETPMDYTSFFRARQEARYGAGATRCC